MVAIKNKINDAIDRLKLDLSGKIVLTEAASGPYVVTSVIAALAGAEVYAFTKATRYGSVEDVSKQTLDLLSQFNTPHKKLNIISELTPEIIGKADIITNSGHLRPLNKELLQYAKKEAVLPLMFEAWEWRESDIDVNTCKEKNIVLGATNERHPDVDVFGYLGDMALKMIFDAGLCPYRNNFILICNNDFGPFIAKTLTAVCNSLAVCDIEENKHKYKNLPIDWIGNFPEFTVPEKYKKCEAVLFTAYPFEKTWISKHNTPISIEKLKREIENPYILRYCGHIDEDSTTDFNFFPEHVKAGHMGVLPSAIGFDPIIRLQSGSLKVAELLTKKQTSWNGVELAEIIKLN